VFVSPGPYSQFITTMSIDGSTQSPEPSDKLNSSLESFQVEPQISGWPELVVDGSVWRWPIEDEPAVSDIFTIHFNFH
jgi:hypothetical protein